jgi:photosystem II stability/assembly factor-like uncharacterized protein
MLITQKEALKQYTEDARLWQGIPSVECTKRGRLFVTFYSGGEGEPRCGNYCLLLKSDDGGKSWSDPIAVAYDGEAARTYDPALWIDPLDRLWFVWSASPDYRVEAAICDDPDAEELVFSDPIRVGFDVMLNKPLVRGEDWLFPCTVWEPSIVPPAKWGAGPSPHPTGAHVFVTRDAGKTFSLLGSANGENRSFDEHMILENRDGTLSMYTRTTYGIGKATSTDGGATWSPITDSGIPNPCSRFHIRRLPSGRVLLVAHHEFTGRNNLAAFLSDDDGKTFPHVLLLDGRESVSYPDAAVAADGRIYTVHDRERGARYRESVDYSNAAREILISSITEEEILAGKLVHPDSYLARPVSALGRRETQKP